MKRGAVVGGQKFFCQHFLTPKRSGLSACAAWHQKLKQKTKKKLVTTNGEYMGKKREERGREEVGTSDACGDQPTIRVGFC